MPNDIQSFILHFLKNEPFNLNLTPLQFDQLPANQLIQILSDVLSWIFQTDKIDIRREPAEDTAIRILNLLRILRYRPPTDPEELEEWRVGVVEGSKSSMYPLLVFLFENSEALKERAYLAKFLMKTEVPSEVHDYDTAELQNEIQTLQNEFKEVHAENKEVQADVLMLEDIKEDLKSMEKEKQLLIRKIEKLEKKVQNIPYFDRHMEVASELRAQRDRVSEYAHQKHQERQKIIAADNRINRLQAMLEELRSADETIDQTSVMEKLEDEVATNNYLVNEKLVEDIEDREKRLKELTEMARTAAIRQEDIDKLQEQVEEISKRIKTLEEERDQIEEDVDDNMSVFRHQVNALERKKETAVQKLQDARHDLSKLEAEIDTKKSRLQNELGGEVLSTVQYKKYLDRFRARNEEHKRKKKELNDLQSERTILKRTVEILTEAYEELRTNIENLGGEVVEVLHVPLAHERPRTAAPSTNDADKLKTELREMMSALENRKNVISDYRSTRDVIKSKSQMLTAELEEMKQRKQRKEEEREEMYSNLVRNVTEMENKHKQNSENLIKRKDELAEYLSELNNIQQYGNNLEELEASVRDIEAEEESLKSKNDSMKSMDAIREQYALWNGLHEIFALKVALLKNNERY
ncbi:unnamed protein product [Caenorhabditis bovis]|uniref:Intraflagellar transport protein 81 homolog n=1 Tax=Caenorhabditis bovis TaxID=2654633 RepID=A0A8S1EM24_9PELO|nr:unnamed protein product [Caenorhabditis bovis]